jgi:hypothetical protein
MDRRGGAQRIQHLEQLGGGGHTAILYQCRIAARL